MSPRLDRYGDPVEDDQPDTLPAAPRRRKPERKGRPIGGLAAAVEAAGGKCDRCHQLVCACCRYCGGRVRPGWAAHPACERTPSQITQSAPSAGTKDTA